MEWIEYNFENRASHPPKSGRYLYTEKNVIKCTLNNGMVMGGLVAIMIVHTGHYLNHLKQNKMELEEKFKKAIHDEIWFTDACGSEGALTKQCVQIAHEFARYRMCDFYDWLAKQNRLQYNGVPNKINMVDTFLQHLKENGNK